jgi:hypothetical protein
MALGLAARAVQVGVVARNEHAPGHGVGGRQRQQEQHRAEPDTA